MKINPNPNRLSPIHSRHQTLVTSFNLRDGWLVPESYTSSVQEAAVLRESVGLVDISAWGKLILKGDNTSVVIAACFGESPSEPGDVIELKSDQFLLAKLTPDEFLILTPPSAEKELAARLQAEIAFQDIFVSIIDQTSGLVGLSISGPKSTWVMRKLCAMPFNSKDFPILYVTQSSFANVRATVIRHDQGASLAFKLFADRSYGEYLWDAILDAGREFGIQPVGWEAVREPNQDSSD